MITFSNPQDGDSLASALALLSFLEKMGKQAEIVCPDFKNNFLEIFNFFVNHSL